MLIMFGMGLTLRLPDFADYAVRVQAPATVLHEATRVLGTFLRDVIAAISDASSEQRTGIGHVNTAIAGMDVVTQQNAALVEEAAAAAASLEEQAAQLAEVVSVFRMDAASAPRAPASSIDSSARTSRSRELSRRVASSDTSAGRLPPR